MISLMADEDFNARIVRGLRRLIPEISVLSVQEAKLARTPDAEILDHAADDGRVLLTHDVNTMVAAATERVHLGRPMPGVIVVPQLMRIGHAVSDLSTLVSCSDPSDFQDQIWFLPL